MWGQINQPILTLGIIQNKALRIINFEHPRSSINVLYHEYKILKLKIILNFLFAYDSFTNNLPFFPSHLLDIRNVQHKLFIVPTARTMYLDLIVLNPNL